MRSTRFIDVDLEGSAAATVDIDVALEGSAAATVDLLIWLCSLKIELF